MFPEANELPVFISVLETPNKFTNEKRVGDLCSGEHGGVVPHPGARSVPRLFVPVHT